MGAAYRAASARHASRPPATGGKAAGDLASIAPTTWPGPANKPAGSFVIWVS